ncbi:MAG: acetyltransferase family protein [Acidimicrobiaceae bacterium]|nr:acetyltransferase family protein [Acidimicrobiaceae bacterium]
MHIRSVTSKDAPAILALNAESESALSPLDAEALDTLLATTALALLAVDGEGEGDEVLGFALAFGPGATYDSANYRWFEQRYDSYLYLDRIAVDGRHRRRGVGRAIYDEMERHAEPSGRMLCEVNLVPPNDTSLAFHASRGYDQVGTLEHTGGKVVVMLAKELRGS